MEDAARHESVALQLSVREFVESVLPRGSIDASMSYRLEEDAMQAGTGAHTRVQRGLEIIPGYRKEVALAQELHGDGWTLALTGRVDGVFERSATGPIVEEIKSSLRMERLVDDLNNDPNHIYILQAKVYAWMFAKTRELNESPRCRLRLVCLKHSSETLRDLEFSTAEFEVWVHQQAQSHVDRELARRLRMAERLGMVANLKFPFSLPRPGQTELVAAVKNVVKKRSKLMVQAPTGLGKTLGVLFPALEVALEEDLRVFYCTPRNSQHRLAEEVVRRLRAQGHELRSVTIRAKEKVCPRGEVHCTPKACEYADGHYERMRENHVLESLLAEGCMDVETVARHAMASQICPFELSLDASLQADVVICDYNYIFSPNATLLRFFADPADCARNVVLVDEAHNLYARAMDWFSPALSTAFFDSLSERKTAAKTRLFKSRYRKACKACRVWLETLAGPDRFVEVDADQLYEIESTLARLLADALSEGEELTPQDPLCQLSRTWTSFCDIYRLKRPEVLLTWRRYESGGGKLQITCADAAFHMTPRIRQLAAIIMFSATLKPFSFHQALCGLPDDTDTVEFPSPFSAENRKVMIIPQISTAWRDREAHAPRIGEVISRVLPLRQGNYFIFFPSFHFLEMVVPHVDLPDFAVVVQPRGASQAEVEALMERLEHERNLVLFAVQGGSFSEGIDCPGERLIGVVVVGPPLPPYDLEREGLKDFYEKKYGQGFLFAYVYPAMAKVAQSAGRVIRTDEDRGLMLLLDRRFLTPNYANCMPSDWFTQTPQELVSSAILRDVTSFWSETGV